MTQRENQRIDEGTLEKIWATLPPQICQRHRTNKRNGYLTDWDIEELRNKNYSSYEAVYFRNHMVELANRHPEIHVEGNIVRVTPQGEQYCIDNIPGIQDDFRQQ